MCETLTIRKLVEAVQRFRDAREWRMYHKPKDLAMVIAIESTELLELFLWLNEEDIERLSRNSHFIGKVAEEIVDILIFILSLADIMGIDIAEWTIKKLRKNEEKYPPNKFRGPQFKKWLINQLGQTK